jgi:hypothetical protein
MSASEPFVAMGIWVTGALTVLSATMYFRVWLNHMASYEPQPERLPACKSRRERSEGGFGQHGTSGIATEADLTGWRRPRQKGRRLWRVQR